MQYTKYTKIFEKKLNHVIYNWNRYTMLNRWMTTANLRSSNYSFSNGTTDFVLYNSSSGCIRMPRVYVYACVCVCVCAFVCVRVCVCVYYSNTGSTSSSSDNLAYLTFSTVSAFGVSFTNAVSGHLVTYVSVVYGSHRVTFAGWRRGQEDKCELVRNGCGINTVL